jgi:hypothetical protein
VGERGREVVQRYFRTKQEKVCQGGWQIVKQQAHVRFAKCKMSQGMRQVVEQVFIITEEDKMGQ